MIRKEYPERSENDELLEPETKQVAQPEVLPDTQNKPVVPDEEKKEEQASQAKPKGNF